MIAIPMWPWNELRHESAKPHAGTLFAYPATTLHRVASLTRGSALPWSGGLAAMCSTRPNVSCCWTTKPRSVPSLIGMENRLSST
jgi:hypothetical protein